MAPKRVISKTPDYGLQTKVRGHQSESRALHVALQLTVPWVLGARAGLPEEDPLGIDLVVFTDLGPIGVQVKSSPRAISKFKKRVGASRLESLAVIQVGDLPDSEVLEALSSELSRIRLSMQLQKT